MLAWLLLLTLQPADDDGYTYPPERRGELVATFSVRVPEGTGPVRVYYTLTVEGGPQLEVESPELTDASAAWTAQRSSSWSLANGQATWAEDIELEQVKPGLLPLPDVKLFFRDGPAATRQEVEWREVLKDIRELPGPTPPPATASASAMSRWGWIGIVATLAVACGLAVALLRRRRVEAPLSPDLRALRELERLEQLAGKPGHPWGSMFASLSDVFRRYLAERFGLPAFRRTTAEFLLKMDEAEPLIAEKEFLREFLELCDLAKFAGISGDHEQWLLTVGQVRAFIQRTAHVQSSAVIPATQTVRNRYSREPGNEAHTDTN
jgi:hypothetical protein